MQSSKVEIPAPTSKMTHLDMLGTQHLWIKRDLIIPSHGSIWIHLCSVGDMFEGNSIYVGENEYVRD